MPEHAIATLAIDTGKVTTATSTTLVDSSKAWAIDIWKDYTVCILTGTGQGQARLIISNTSNSLTVAAWDTQPKAGAEFSISLGKAVTGAAPDPKVTVGSYEFQPDSPPTLGAKDVIVLVASVIRTTNPADSNMQKQFATAGYQVTAGKTLIITKLRIGGTVTGINSIRIKYGDDDVGRNSASDLTNPVNLDEGSGSVYTLIAAASVVYEYDVHFQFPAGKYPAIRANTNSSTTVVAMEGYEIDE